MKKLFKIGLTSFLLVTSFSTYSMQVNSGSITSFNCNISTYKYINNGTVYGINSVKVDVSSLTGSGTISAVNKDVSIKTGYFGYTGTILAGESCDIKANIFEGTATIEAPSITIIADEFKFNGTLSCDKNCNIYTKKSFDINSFKRRGRGTFKIIISSYEVKYFNQAELALTAYNYFYGRCTNLKEVDIDAKIKEIRAYAALNFIDEKAVFDNIKKNLEEKVNFHQQRLEEKRDIDSLYVFFAKWGISATGLLATYVLFVNEQTLTTTFKAEEGFIKLLSCITAAASTLPAIFSYSDFYNWKNPRHKEKYESLSLIISRIDHALAVERVPEEQIFNL